MHRRVACPPQSRTHLFRGLLMRGEAPAGRPANQTGACLAGFTPSLGNPDHLIGVIVLPEDLHVARQSTLPAHECGLDYAVRQFFAGFTSIAFDAIRIGVAPSAGERAWRAGSAGWSRERIHPRLVTGRRAAHAGRRTCGFFAAIDGGGNRFESRDLESPDVPPGAMPVIERSSCLGRHASRPLAEPVGVHRRSAARRNPSR